MRARSAVWRPRRSVATFESSGANLDRLPVPAASREQRVTGAAGAARTRGPSYGYWVRLDASFLAFFSFFCLVVSLGWFDLGFPLLWSLLATDMSPNRMRFWLATIADATNYS
jgi:hypothetical protein